MAADRSTIDDDGPLAADRRGIDDPPMNVSLLGVVPGPTHSAGAPQVLEELLLQGATRLDKEGSIDSLVRHA